MTKKTNDLKKGTPVTLRNGWDAIIMDNRRGNIRLAEVYGIYTEVGSVYAHNIVRALVDGEYHDIEYTPAQIKERDYLS